MTTICVIWTPHILKWQTLFSTISFLQFSAKRFWPLPPLYNRTAIPAAKSLNREPTRSWRLKCLGENCRKTLRPNRCQSIFEYLVIDRLKNQLWLSLWIVGEVLIFFLVTWGHDQFFDILTEALTRTMEKLGHWISLMYPLFVYDENSRKWNIPQCLKKS